jgi:hypothetical protein
MANLLRSPPRNQNYADLGIPIRVTLSGTGYNGPFSPILQWQALQAGRRAQAQRGHPPNIPTAEMESFFRRDEDAAPRPPKRYPRARPLAEGETRTAEEPSQPELIWNGTRITITAEQMRELAETGALTLSDAQLVWRGKGPSRLDRPRRQRAATVHTGENTPQGRHRRPEAPHGGEARGEGRDSRPVRRFQRHHAGAACGVLSARPALVEPRDPRRQPSSDGEPVRA